MFNISPSSMFKFIKSLRKRWLVAAAVGVGVALLAFGALILSGRNSSDDQSGSVNNVAVDKCKATETFTCYKAQLNEIVKQQNPRPAFDFVKDRYAKVTLVKSQCHQLVHVIGRAAYVKYDDLADTFVHGDQFCWAGYYHGVMEQLAEDKGADYVAKNMNNICAGIATKQRQSFYHFNCVHGLGHGLMEVLDANLFSSLKSCDDLTDGWERSSCYGGVFMQNIMNVQSLDNTVDNKSEYLRPNEPMYPCTAIDDRYKEQCYLMQTSYALQMAGYDFSKVFAMCAGVEQTYQATCYQSLGRDASGQSISDPDKTRSTCLMGQTEDAQSNCIIGAAKDFVSYFHSDAQANKLCDSLDANLKQICASTVKNYYAVF